MRLDANNVKLIVFGEIASDMSSTIKGLNYEADERIKFLGWLDQPAIYNLIIAADAVIFPGTHSVLWEQAIGLGCPLIVRKWSQIDHINKNENVLWLDNGETEEIEEKLRKVVKSHYMLDDLKNRTIEIMNEFRYSFIAKKSIEKL